ncbi:zinc-ribbon domain-containing protein [Streptomyces sp. NPDC056347]|uniref:NADase-type glycan-binding domain-containing protein n=1 Tax=Streptomyces sp. NPDC056347 TaxID=3345790 RepID=UPI0035DB44B1
MRSCPACGAANREDDEFCGNCGSYLGWSSRQPDSTPAPAPAPAPAPEPTGPAAPDSDPAAEPAAGPATAPAAGRTSGTAPEPTPEPPTPVPALPVEPARTRAPEPAEPPPPVPVTTPTPAPTPVSSPDPDPAPEPEPVPEPAPPAAVRPALPAAAKPQPPAPRTDGSDEPVGAVQPARPVTRRPVVRPVAAEEEPDGPPCPACGTPNLPGRRFCRRCAAPLRPKEEAAPLPWWRTVWPFRRRVRSGSGRALRRTVLALAVVGLLFVGYLLVPAGRYAYEDVRDKLGKTAEIGPSGVTASADTPGHPAKAVTDSLTNRYWAAPDLGASLTFTFDRPFRMVGVVIYPGSSTKPEEFRQTGRPTEIEMIVTKKDGGTETVKLKLNDKPGKFTERTRISDAVSVKLVTRAASGQGEGRPIAVGEVEFYRRA